MKTFLKVLWVIAGIVLILGGYIANKDIRLIGSNFGKAIDRPLKYFLFTDGKVQYFT